MSEVRDWEREFVRHYVRPEKRDRYLFLLKGRKHRREVLDRLDRALDYDPAWATTLGPSEQDPESLWARLAAEYVQGTAYVMSACREFDRRELRLEPALEALLACPWGTVLICPRSGPPVPVALYRPEAPAPVVLLAR